MRRNWTTILYMMFLIFTSIAVYIMFWFIASPKHIPCDHNLTFEYVINESSEESIDMCCWCGYIIFEDFIQQTDHKITLPEKDSLYIDGANIKTPITISNINQSSVDEYDVIYSEDWGIKNPFILGHDYRSLRTLHKTEVGEFIYLCVDGRIKKYEVVLSEPARKTTDGKNIISKSGKSIYHNYGCETLHLYTCYGISKNGRWMVLAVPE